MPEWTSVSSFTGQLDRYSRRIHNAWLLQLQSHWAREDAVVVWGQTSAGKNVITRQAHAMQAQQIFCPLSQLAQMSGSWRPVCHPSLRSYGALYVCCYVQYNSSVVVHIILNCTGPTPWQPLYQMPMHVLQVALKLRLALLPSINQCMHIIVCRQRAIWRSAILLSNIHRTSPFV